MIPRPGRALKQHRASALRIETSVITMANGEIPWHSAMRIPISERAAPICLPQVFRVRIPTPEPSSFFVFSPICSFRRGVGAGFRDDRRCALALFAHNTRKVAVFHGDWLGTML